MWNPRRDFVRNKNDAQVDQVHRTASNRVLQHDIQHFLAFIEKVRACTYGSLHAILTLNELIRCARVVLRNRVATRDYRLRGVTWGLNIPQTKESRQVITL
jgi:hypothetical protein